MNRPASQWRSLSTKITLATLGIFLAGIWSLSFYAAQMLRQDMQARLGEQQFSTVSLVAAQVESELSSRLQTLQTVARSAAQVMQDGGPAAMQRFVDERVALQTLFNGGITVHDASGTVIADYPASAGRIGVNDMDIDVIAAALKDAKASIGSPGLDKKLGKPVFGLAAPLLDGEGRVIGALSGVINLGIPSFLEEITRSHYGKTGGYLLVSRLHRMVVTATNRMRVMEALPGIGGIPLLDRFVEGFEGSGIAVNTVGVEVLASGKHVPAADWLVVATFPTEEAFAPIRDMQRRMLLATIVLTLVAGLLTVWLLRRQLSPLRLAANRLAEMHDDSKALRALPVVRPDEIGQLVGGFNDLLKTLGQREIFLQQILDTSSVAIFMIDMRGRITQANRRMSEMFAMPVDELLGNEYVALVHPSEREASREKMLALLASQIPAVDLDRLYWRADQTGFWGHLNGRQLLDANGVKLGLVGVIADIDVRKRAEERLQLAASVFTHAREGILITSADGTIIDVNEAFTRITGYERGDVLGQKPRILKSGHHTAEFYAELWRELIATGHWYGEIWNRRKDGEVYAEMKTISAVRDAQGNTLQYVALFSDITPIKEHEKQLEQIAHYDVLTTLPNRVLLADRLHQAMVQAHRYRQILAVAYLDLDGFKAINDTYGHETGDQLLIALARRMKETLRESDTLARLGGDEFVAVLLDIGDVAASVPMLSRLLAAAAEPVAIGDRVLQVSASLGVTFFPQTDDVDADQLLRQADQAMYQAKVAGKNRYHVFDADQDRSVRGHHESLEHIRRALTANEFVLHYQPKVNMRTGAVIGAEALIRWQHPEKGLLPPSVFLPVIENHALAIDLGEWVIARALVQMAEWRAGGLHIPVSVNISARQLQQSGFPLRLATILAANPDARVGDLELEVLETSALEDLIGVSRVMRDCRDLGIEFALDDFGTGYSSLTYLKRLPVSLLKIDQSFVRDMLDDPDDLAILEGVISLAAAFRRQVIAEGVETVEHGKMLLQLGCELAQGYGIARPMPAADLHAWVTRWRPDPDWSNLQSVDRDDYPLLFAATEHRAWIAAMENHLKDARNEQPAMDFHRCRFGQWLDADGQNRYGAHPEFWRIEHLHRQVHDLAETLRELRKSRSFDEVRGDVHKLHALRDQLLARMQLLLHHSRP
ncbi:MAG: EAL domain-containing protein [Propionivibrio sp.]